MADRRELRPYNFEPRRGKRRGGDARGDDRDVESDHELELETDASASASASGSSASGLSSTSTGRSRIDDKSKCWCTCGNCEPLIREVECVCCKEVAAVADFIDRTDDNCDDKCIIDCSEFKNCCLNRSMLEVTEVMQRHNRGYTGPLGAMENRMYRFLAYKSFTALIHKSLGKGNRRVIPACAVVKIHESFPENSGVYTGFKFGNVVSEHCS